MKKKFKDLPKEVQEEFKAHTEDEKFLELMAIQWHAADEARQELKKKETAEETRLREEREAAEAKAREEEKAAELERLKQQNQGAGNDKLLESIQELITTTVGSLKEDLGGRLSTLEQGYQSQQQQQSSAVEADNKARLEKYGDAAKAFIEASGKEDPAEIKALLDSGEKAGLFTDDAGGNNGGGGGNSNRSNGRRGGDKPRFTHNNTNNNGGGNNNADNNGFKTMAEIRQESSKWLEQRDLN